MATKGRASPRGPGIVTAAVLAVSAVSALHWRQSGPVGGSWDAAAGRDQAPPRTDSGPDSEMRAMNCWRMASGSAPTTRSTSTPPPPQPIRPRPDHPHPPPPPPPPHHHTHPHHPQKKTPTPKKNNHKLQ